VLSYVDQQRAISYCRHSLGYFEAEFGFLPKVIGFLDGSNCHHGALDGSPPDATTRGNGFRT
jgi:hypothetical protein